MSKPKKKNCFISCMKCCLVTFAIFFVLFVAAGAVGLGFADKFLRENYEIGVWECMGMVTSVLDNNEKKAVNDPATEQDNTKFYSELKKTLFLSPNVDLESILTDYILYAVNDATDEGTAYMSSAQSSDETQDGDDNGKMLRLIEQLYSDGNVDMTRLRGYLNSDADIDALYDAEFTLGIKGNYFVKLFNTFLQVSMQNDRELEELADHLRLRQFSVSKSGGDIKLTAVMQIDLRNFVKASAQEQIYETLNGAPAFLADMIFAMVPQRVFFGADIVLGETDTFNLRINGLQGSEMTRALRLIEKISGEDIDHELYKPFNEMIGTVRNEMPTLIEILESVDDAGMIKLDAYGLIADAMRSESGERLLEGNELVKFLVGALGSDEQKAIADRIAADSRFGRDDWEEVYAKQLVATMADSFALAKNYFVNGCDENGNKIISVENGMVVGLDKIIGRVYSDAAGNLYYKTSGGRKKLFIGDNKNVSRLPLDGYATFMSTELHYMSGGEDYILYISEDEQTVYGVCGDKVQDKNGTYTELTTLYVDEAGNVYSKQNAENSYIEVSKEQLTADTVMNMLSGDNFNAGDIMKLIDTTVLKTRGARSWLEPVAITDIELAAIVGGMVGDSLPDNLSGESLRVAYAKLDSAAGTDTLIIGVELDVRSLLSSNNMGFAAALIGEKIYIELECDITLGKEQSAYAPVKLRYNDLSDAYTQSMLSVIAKLDSEMNLTGELENAAREIREVLKNLNDVAGIEIQKGKIVLSSPADIIISLLPDSGDMTKEKLVDAITLMFTSDYAVAIDGISALYPEFAGTEWKQTAVNTLVEDVAEAFIMRKEVFLSDDNVNYSFDKISDIIIGGNMTMENFTEYFDIERMTEDGFADWKRSSEISDVQFAAVIDSLKNEYFAQDDLTFDIIYAGLNGGNRQFVTLGLVCDTASLFGSVSGEFSSLFDAIGDALYLQIKVDVTDGTSDYADCEIILNDMTAAETDKVMGLMIAMYDAFDLSGIEGSIRGAVQDLTGAGMLTVEDGKLVVSPAQDIIFDVLVENPAQGFTASNMTDALTAVALSGKRYAAEHNNLIADTSLDSVYARYWDDVLRDKYLVDIGIGELFPVIASGGDIYDTIAPVLRTDEFVDVDGNFIHASVQDSHYAADNACFSWLLRSNVASVTEMFGSDTFAAASIYDAYVKLSNDRPTFGLIVALPTDSIVNSLGSMNDSITGFVSDLLGQTVGVEIEWEYCSGKAEFSLNGMTDSEKTLFDDLVYSLTGQRFFADNDEIEGALLSVSETIDSYFVVTTENGQCFTSLDPLYSLIASVQFPKAEGKPEITETDVYELFRTIYCRPERAGQFDSACLGYESQPTVLEAVSRYVTDDSYSVVGAMQTTAIKPVPVAKITATICYRPSGLAALSDILPDAMYITLLYDAHPAISGMNVSVEDSTLEARINTATDNTSIDACLEYLGIDINAQIDKAHRQLDNYVTVQMSLLS